MASSVAVPGCQQHQVWRRHHLLAKNPFVFHHGSLWHDGAPALTGFQICSTIVSRCWLTVGAIKRQLIIHNQQLMNGFEHFWKKSIDFTASWAWHHCKWDGSSQTRHFGQKLMVGGIIPNQLNMQLIHRRCKQIVIHGFEAGMPSTHNGDDYVFDRQTTRGNKQTISTKLVARLDFLNALPPCTHYRGLTYCTPGQYPLIFNRFTQS